MGAGGLSMRSTYGKKAARTHSATVLTSCAFAGLMIGFDIGVIVLIYRFDSLAVVNLESVLGIIVPFLAKPAMVASDREASLERSGGNRAAASSRVLGVRCTLCLGFVAA